MKHLLLTSTVILSLGSIASAADLPSFEPAPELAPAPAYSWTGFYAGVHGGYSFGDNDDNILEFDTDGDGDFGDTVLTGLGADAFAPGFESDFDDGVNVGGRIGYTISSAASCSASSATSAIRTCPTRSPATA